MQQRTHQIEDEEYFSIINKIFIESICQKMSKSKQPPHDPQEHLGKILIEQLIIQTIDRDISFLPRRLESLLAFFRKACQKCRLFQSNDTRIVYRCLLEEISQLGYLVEEDDSNFCQFLSNYFSSYPKSS